MSITIADLQVKATGDTRNAEDAIGRINSEVQKTPGFLANATSTAAGFIIGQVVMRGVGEATHFAADAIIGFNSKLEQAQIGFTTMLGSGEKAQTFLDNLEQFANKTPFQFGGLITSSQRLLAMGFTADEIIPTMTSLGDAVAALGAGDAGIDRATYALGQMRAAGRVGAQDMMQLTSLGIPAWDILAKHIGVTTSEVRKMAEQGVLKTDDAIKALLAGMDERFGGLMEKQSHSFAGAMSTIHDVAEATISKAFRPLFESVSAAANSLATFLQTDEFKAWAESAQAAIGAFIAGIGKAAGILIDVLGPAIGFAVDGIGKLAGIIDAAMGPAVNGIKTVFAGLQPVLQPVITAAQNVVEAIGYIFDVIAGGDDVVSGLRETIQNLAEKVFAFRTKVIEALAGLAKAFVEWIAPLIPKVLDGLSQLGQAIFAFILAQIPVMADQMMAWASSFLDWILPMIGPMTDMLLQWASSMVDWILNTGVPQLAAAMGPMALALIEWIINATPGILAALGEVAIKLLGWIAETAPKIVGKLLEWALAFAGWVATEALPRLIPALLNLGLKLLGWIAGMIPQVIPKLIELAVAMVGALMGFLLQLPGKLVALGVSLLTSIGKWFVDLVGAAGPGASNVVSTIIGFLATLPGKAITAIGGLIGLAIGWFRALPGFLWDSIVAAGGSIVRGLWSGITGLAGWLWGKVSGWVSGLIGGVLDWLGIHSPSRVFEGIGEQMIRGLARGILSSGGAANAALTSVVDGMGASMSLPGLSVTGGALTAAMTPSVTSAPGMAGGSGVTVIMQVERFAGTADEARYYADLIARDLRLRLPS